MTRLRARREKGFFERQSKAEIFCGNEAKSRCRMVLEYWSKDPIGSGKNPKELMLAGC